ncbi:SH3 domain-containing protein [Rufibacter roseus]|uniref:SH3 domain-containing protein n=1 Tax=Rufibacter roseus TaxID=1567108 RepID=A0ABW2DJG7_9BACT|nr:SH3 domain-containing protein [Rufibacter roseus]
MKRFLLLSALILAQVFTVFAQTPATRENDDQIAMHRQPSMSTEVMRYLNPGEHVTRVRKINDEWSLVTIDGEGGYVLNTFLKASRNKKKDTAKSKTVVAPSASLK